MDSEIESLIGMVIIEKRLIDERNIDNDVRYTYEIKTKHGKYCMKLHHNSFTTKERVNKTAKLVIKYNELGFYSPKYIKLPNGSYSVNIIEDNLLFVLWVEEFSKYETTNDKEIVLSHDFQLQIADYIGIVSNGLKNYEFDFKSPYVMYLPFDNTTRTDEYEEYLEKVYSQLSGNQLVNQDNLEYVREFFYTKRAEIKNKYDKLPSAAFQDDLQIENLLIFKKKFKGVLDFNLSGTEKVLTYFINETAHQESEAIGINWISNDYVELHLSLFKEKLQRFKMHYSLNKLELGIIEDLYKVIVPYKYFPLTEILGYTRLHDFDEVNYRLQWMINIIEKELNLN